MMKTVARSASRKRAFPRDGYLEATAWFSDCGQFRYRLTRRWSDGPTIAFIGLNPSSANAEILDPTVTRCVRRAQTLGYGAITMLNLFAFVSTDRSVLATRERVGLPIVGDRTDQVIRRETARANLVLCCWGVTGALGGRSEDVLTGVLRDRRLHCLRKTLGGHPEHPLYLPYALKPVPLSRGNGHRRRRHRAESLPAKGH
ncbi:hypothetical protein AYO47_02100 [Planctomyces sp. SCGC AG-212-M04]|nr:hypothetical protein AYO47_02100 [Planctomyces sp. SCGC AG-212-M04]